MIIHMIIHVYILYCIVVVPSLEAGSTKTDSLLGSSLQPAASRLAVIQCHDGDDEDDDADEDEDDDEDDVQDEDECWTLKAQSRNQETRHTSYLSPISTIYRWGKNLSCGEISGF